MKSFFDRHSTYKKNHKTPRDKEGPSSSYISWLLWGGDAGYTWSKKILNQIEKADEKD